ncbi:MAG: cation diffusion facilitator family transporter [Akkermansiaceae bacterium]|jgi:cation diffusion facilitator family transporter|nr:cation diffusion facilitator family transporter [Akkermansiaceae bacterium]MDP4645521.1 cation diffusion facilitator family transporter [Akkermansiaceae bacterium]MDP4719864.1 cation diffusion facilitator family transporter [Akkermansiaceae bacterium]MDP4778672.1 cation diffusion facilitator family transporter [Akkermansiaceae bacterium]MDP4848264.1 cation diffusion facilitator family transporter [Akkermansiaceae bacterium]
MSGQKNAINLSLAVAVILLAAKTFASVITGSSSIYSDAAESVVHVFAVLFAFWALRFSHKPADKDHHYGHDKISFISAGFEGAMISSAAALILYEAGKQFVHGVELDHLNVGLWITGAAASVNLMLGLTLIRIGRSSGSPLILANGKHVLTDVWTSGAVICALVLIQITEWLWWDPIFAVIAAFNILRVGIGLIKDSFSGLLDEADPVLENSAREMLNKLTADRGLSYHNFRHRHSGRSHWIEFHLVFPNGMTVETAHHQATEIEAAVAKLGEPDCRVITHLEPQSSEERIEHWERP